jgi:uncharacterized membrane protein
MPKHRLESFSDGVFAIVITLLILNIHLDRNQELTVQTLVSLGPDLLAFVLSFVIVGVYWVSHHSMMHMIKTVDRRLLWLNLLVLLAVVFIPFPAWLLGQHLWNPLAAITYGLNLMTVNALGTVLWLYAGSRAGMMIDGVSPRTVHFVARLHSAPIVVYALAVVLAPWLTAASIVLFAAVPAFFIVPNPFLERRLAELGGTPRPGASL